MTNQTDINNNNQQNSTTIDDSQGGLSTTNTANVKAAEYISPIDSERSSRDITNTKAARITDQSADNKLPSPDDHQLGNSHLEDTNPSHLNKKTTVGGRLELLEERPVVNKERLDVGKVTVTKHARTKTITVPIELIEEYITIQTEYSDADEKAFLTGDYNNQDMVKHVEPTLDTHAVVTINGNQVQIGDEPVEIVVSRQVAVITKETHVIQEVDVSKTTHTHTDNIQVSLQHEELEVFEEGFLEHDGKRYPK